MVTKTICDRCGKDTGQHGVKVSVDGFYETMGQDYSGYDLCQSCFKLVQGWVKNGG